MRSKLRRSTIFGFVLTLCVAVSYFILATQPGLEISFRLAQRLLPGTLQVVGLQGRLMGPLQAKQLVYRTPDFTLSISQLSLDWGKWALFRGYLCIKPLVIERLHLDYHAVQAAQIHRPSAQTILPLPKWLSRLRLSDLSLWHALLKFGDSADFELQGTLHQQWQLSWKFRSALKEWFPGQTGDFILSGVLTGHWRKQAQLALEAHSQPFAWVFAAGTEGPAKSLMMPVMRLQGTLNSAGLRLALSTDQKQQKNHVKAWVILPKYQGTKLPKASQAIQVAAHLRLTDGSVLRPILPQSFGLALSQATGVLTSDLGLQGSFGRLQSCLSQSESCLLKHHFVRHLFSPPLEAQFSLHWQKPSFPAAGLRFDHLSLNAHLDHDRVIWQGQLAAAADGRPGYPSPEAKWKLSGKTQLTFEPDAYPNSQTNQLIEHVAPSAPFQKYGSTPSILRFSRHFLSATDLSHYWKTRFLEQPTLSKKSTLHIATELRLVGDALLFFDATRYHMQVAPDLTLTAAAKATRLEGTLYLPAARLDLGDGEREVVMLDKDVRFVDGQRSHSTLELQPYPFYAQLNLQLGKDVFFRYNRLSTRLEGGLTLLHNPERAFFAEGEIQLVAGRYRYYGQQLAIEPESRLIFTEQLLDNPRMNISASRIVEVKPAYESGNPTGMVVYPITSPTPMHYGLPNHPIEVKVGLQVRGPIAHPQYNLFAEPASLIRNPADQLSYLVTGHPSHELTTASTRLLLSAASDFSSDGEENNQMMMVLQKKTGLDQISIQPDLAVNPDTQDLTQNTVLVLGKQFTPRLSLVYSIGLLSNPNHRLKLNYLLTRHFSLEGSIGNVMNSADLLFQIERG